MKITLKMFLSTLLLMSCGKYPQKPEVTEIHKSAIGEPPGTAELTGEGYVPQFLAPGYRTLDVEYEVREAIVDLGGGFKYRALTFDGSFPAKTLIVEQETLVRIKFKNSDSEPHGMHTHILKYTAKNNGAAQSQTEAGDTRYYFWEVTQSTPVGFYPFHDHGGDNEGAMARGLIGMVNVVKSGESAKGGYGILLHDLNMAYLFSDSGARLPDNSNSHAHGMGGETKITRPAHLINGKFGSAPENTFQVKLGDKIRVGVVNLGSNIHTFHPHGNGWTESDGTKNDNLALSPGGFRTVELNAEVAGTWLFHCHVPGHTEGGMWGKYIVR